MTTKQQIKNGVQENIQKILAISWEEKNIEIDLPPNEKLGDYAFGCFSLGKNLDKNPVELAEALAKNFKANELIKQVKNVGPYLNIFINPQNFIKAGLDEIINAKNFGNNNLGQSQKVLIEFSGPNTNKPQHLGHVRNNVIGQSLVNILRACNYQVVPVNIVNDRGIHIMKSMLAWQKFANGETPESSGMKGDHLVGKYYVKFSQELKVEQDKYFQTNNVDLTKLSDQEKKGAEEKFLAQSKLMTEAQTMLKAWEDNDPKVRELWQMMNDWVYHGLAETYQALGISFDKVYYESDVYLLGKDLIQQGLEEKIFFKKKDGSIWVDLTKEDLGEKLLLRKDGTAVYMTQDLGMAKTRHDEYNFDQAIYVVASEQNYHFQALFIILQKLGFAWADNLHHLAYGMVSLPEGRMKSREGKIVDADDLIVEMKVRAQEVIESATKKVSTNNEDKEKITKVVGMGALKFYMLGTNPQKDVTFNPQESISFDGYTGTFIQYTHARINNILIKAKNIKPLNELDFSAKGKKNGFNPEEIKLIKTLLNFPETIQQTAKEYNPSILTQYLFELAKAFNNFYQHHSVLQAENDNLKDIRLHLCRQTQKVLNKGLGLLGIEAPKVM